MRMSLPSGGHLEHGSPESRPTDLPSTTRLPDTPVRRELLWLDASDPEPRPGDPGTVILTCANCGAEMIERKCKLICRCGYFLSCSDYY